MNVLTNVFNVQDVPILIADSAEQSSVDAVALQTDVLLTTAGPYQRIGMPVVQVRAEKKN